MDSPKWGLTPPRGLPILHVLPLPVPRDDRGPFGGLDLFLGGAGHRADPHRDLRRLACDASVMRVVLSERSEPLDVGRRSKVVPPPMRRAVIVRDRRCRFPGCATGRTPGAMRTRSSTGPTAVRPPCRTSSCSVANTTERSTPGELASTWTTACPLRSTGRLAA